MGEIQQNSLRQFKKRFQWTLQQRQTMERSFAKEGGGEYFEGDKFAVQVIKFVKLKYG